RLVELGAEVHAIDPDDVDVAGLASTTRADVTDGDDARASVARIGAVVDCAFDCTIAADAGHRAFLDAIRAALADHSVIVIVATSARTASVFTDDEPQVRAVVRAAGATVDDVVAQLLVAGASTFEGPAQ